MPMVLLPLGLSLRSWSKPLRDRRNATFLAECAGTPLSTTRTFIARVRIALPYMAWVGMSPMPPAVIQTAIAIIIRFSVSEMKPRGTLLDPPTQAHFNSRLSM